MAAQKLFSFTVVPLRSFPYGARFPLDMLRYDRCWPAGSQDVTLLTRCPDDETVVHLIGLHSPTMGRWESFGWVVRKEATRI